jgi:hypothetical protein
MLIVIAAAFWTGVFAEVAIQVWWKIHRNKTSQKSSAPRVRQQRREPRRWDLTSSPIGLLVKQADAAGCWKKTEAEFRAEWLGR